MVQNCLDYGVRFADVEVNLHQPFAGQTFVFTGSLQQLTRKEAKDILENLISKNFEKPKSRGKDNDSIARHL